jgi:threonine/homoserine/homoserine lactone efflux protein
LEIYLALFFFAVSTGITPGPNNIMLMTSGMNFGIKNSLPHLAGVCVGFTVMVIGIALGFSFVFERFPLLHEAIKVIGVLYLLYLAWLIANASTNSLEDKESKPFSFLQAALFQWVNPKAWVVVTSAVSAYTTVDQNGYWHIVTMASVFFIAAVITTVTWLFFGKGINKILQSKKQQKIFNITMAMLLVLSMLPVIKQVFTHYILGN